MKPLLAIAAALLLAGCASTGVPIADHPEAQPFDASRDANSDVDEALARAAVYDKHVLLIMGGNWCHDSRALAGWLDTPRFRELVAAEYEPVFVDAGVPQTGEGRNLDIARRFGLEDLPGTPNVLVLTADGTLINADSATRWRNAASRSEDDIYAELARLAQE